MSLGKFDSISLQFRLELVMGLFTHSIKYNHMHRDEGMRRGESTESGEKEKERTEGGVSLTFQ